MIFIYIKGAKTMHDVGCHAFFYCGQTKMHDKSNTSSTTTTTSSSSTPISHQDIDKMLNEYRKQNEAKNIFKTAKTPSVIFSVLVFCYLVSGLFGLFGLYAVANLFNFLMTVAILTLSFWSYCRLVS